MLTAALRKEFLLQWRTRAHVMAVFVFGASSLLLFSFAIGPNAELLRQLSAGFLWLALLLSSTLTLSESFHAEMENQALEGLLLLPASARSIYYGKAIANWAQLTMVGIALVPVMVVLYDAGTTRVLALLGVIVLGAAGLSAPGTLYAAMTAQVRARQMLLPLLFFPLIVPALLASVKAASLILLGDPMHQTAEGAAAYRRRKVIVEPVFGWIKRLLGFRQFSFRGLKKNNAEWHLIGLAMNLRRMNGGMQAAVA